MVSVPAAFDDAILTDYKPLVQYGTFLDLRCRRILWAGLE